MKARATGLMNVREAVANTCRESRCY
jgi:hypothetical protein